LVRPSPLAWLLLPFAGLFGLVTGCRRLAYRAGWLAAHRLPVPVIIVGNITVGGTGKTPVTAWLAGLCRDAGLRPGIVSRGYGGPASQDAGWSAPMTTRRTSATNRCCSVGRPERRSACTPTGWRQDGDWSERGVNVVILDDGLQHYRLHRDLEIAVLDGERRLGNGLLLPAGPLREGAARCGPWTWCS
jgi:tetraacyldisaccharide 4'-kinase